MARTQKERWAGLARGVGDVAASGGTAAACAGDGAKPAPELARVLTPEECLQADRNAARANEGEAGARYAVAVAQARSRGAIFDPEEAWHWFN